MQPGPSRTVRPAPDASVAYGDLSEQVVDVWLASAEGDPATPARPLVIVIHGGFWRAEYDRDHIRPLAAALAADGWPVVAIEYRRTGQPGGGWPGTLDDVADAVQRAPELAGDVYVAHGRARPAGPAILLGHSAGGHLALWYAAGPGAAGGVRGVVALAPGADLATAHERGVGGDAVAMLLGGGPADVPQRYARADPAARPPGPVPVVVVHGDKDTDVPIWISRSYLAAARAAGGRVDLVELPGVEHFALIDPWSPAWSSVTTALRSLA